MITDHPMMPSPTTARRPRALAAALWALAAGLPLVGAAPARATHYQVLHDFQLSDGAAPEGALVQGKDGNFYGTTEKPASGTVFRVTPAGVLTTLYSFAGTGDGASPRAGLALGRDGNFYGTTAQGGAAGQGTVFRISPAGAFTVLHSLSGGEGSYAQARLTLGPDGNFYGTTLLGGAAGQGTVFRISPAAPYPYAVLHSFAGGADGGWLYAGVTVGKDGALYGVAGQGGAGNYGTLFRLSRASPYAFTDLHDFTGGADGGTPQSDLAVGPNGLLYGTTSVGGTVFKATTAGAMTTLYTFKQSDGFVPTGSLVVSAGGNVYGTTSQGGANGDGVVYVLTAEGFEAVLHTFNPNDSTDGLTPRGGLTRGADGALYGTTEAGGPSGAGAVFRVGL